MQWVWVNASLRLIIVLVCSELNKARAAVTKVSSLFNRRDPLRKYMDQIVAMAAEYGGSFSQRTGSRLCSFNRDIVSWTNSPHHLVMKRSPSVHCPFAVLLPIQFCNSLQCLLPAHDKQHQVFSLHSCTLQGKQD